MKLWKVLEFFLSEVSSQLDLSSFGKNCDNRLNSKKNGLFEGKASLEISCVSPSEVLGLNGENIFNFDDNFLISNPNIGSLDLVASLS